MMLTNDLTQGVRRYFFLQLCNRHILPMTFQLELHFALAMRLSFNLKILTIS